MSKVVETLRDSGLLLTDYAMSTHMRRYVDAYPRIYALQRLTKLVIKSNQVTPEVLLMGSMVSVSQDSSSIMSLQSSTGSVGCWSC